MSGSLIVLHYLDIYRKSPVFPIRLKYARLFLGCLLTRDVYAKRVKVYLKIFVKTLFDQAHAGVAVGGGNAVKQADDPGQDGGAQVAM